MAKRRKEGRLAINEFPVEIANKLKKVLEIRKNLINTSGTLNVSYFDAKVNRRNKTFAFVEVIVDGQEVETFSIPLTSNDLDNEVCSKIMRKYPNINEDCIKFNNNLVYKKVL